MSYWEDFEADHQYEDDEPYILLHNKTWKTKDGTVLNISEMSDSHITNTINMLQRVPVERRDEIVSSYLELFAQELKSRAKDKKSVETDSTTGAYAVDTAQHDFESVMNANCMGYAVKDLITVAELLKRNAITVNDLHNFTLAFYQGYVQASREYGEAMMHSFNDALSRMEV